MTVLILHGVGGKSGDHWEQWLHDVLRAKGISTLMPQLPHSDHPNRNEWLQTVIDQTKDINESELVIVAHSLGVATALDFIEQTSGIVNALISLSGFPYDYGSELNNYFMKQKNINFNFVRQHLNKSFVIYGDDDPYVPQAALQELAKKLETTPKIVKKGGHMNTGSGFKTYPYLLEIIEKL